MGYLNSYGNTEGNTNKDYYQGNDFGNYQFTSLTDIVNQFMVAYVGENKIISKVKRADVAFHAQRALQELSFDTFKSIKSQQIDLPPTLVMPLPHDYVNYTKLSWTDSSGIKHPLYPTNSTSNPFQINQLDNGDYAFPSGYEVLINGDFSAFNKTAPDNWVIQAAGNLNGHFNSGMGVENGELLWSYSGKAGLGGFYTQVGVTYQQIDVSDLTAVDISADGVVADISFQNGDGDAPVAGATGTAIGTIRFGLTTVQPDGSDLNHVTNGVFDDTPLAGVNMFDLQNNDGEASYLEWTGTENSTKTILEIDVSGVDTIYAVGISFVDLSINLTNGFALNPSGDIRIKPIPTAAAAAAGATGGGFPLGAVTGDGNINSLDNLSLKNNRANAALSAKLGNELNSSTWNNFKSNTPSENNNDDYEDDTYWPMAGNRYGLDPQHAQVNGSFYIDNRLGRIHFSSNISGKAVILDYISDSLGTDGEMQVHKFAEEAMYKCIAHAVVSTKANTQEYIVQRFKKERFAAIRTAKLRLSNVKLEEITQILRGKSKQIKH